jgi:hypothetical protein
MSSRLSFAMIAKFVAGIILSAILGVIILASFLFISKD